MRQVLKYPGSKWNIAMQLVELIPPHHSYVEPYFGSGAVLFRKPPSAIETVNDLDGDVVNLFRCIQQDSERLARLVMTTPFSREIYDRQFESDNSYASRYQRAAGFLAKCWQGHGFRTNGYKVGWKNDVVGREGAYAALDWCRMPERIFRTAERLQGVQIECRPAAELIQRFNYPGVLIYADPPYVLGTRHGKQYRHEMDDRDHEELLDALLASKGKVILSGYDNALYSNRLRGWRREEKFSFSQVGSRKREILWMNFEPPGQMRISGMMGET